jgi:hypothetical protein
MIRSIRRRQAVLAGALAGTALALGVGPVGNARAVCVPISTALPELCADAGAGVEPLSAFAAAGVVQPDKTVLAAISVTVVCAGGPAGETLYVWPRLGLNNAELTPPAPTDTTVVCPV